MTYVIGHKNPDTDSIAAAIAYSHLKIMLKEDVIAGRLGTLNEETKFATRYFNIEAPILLNDARCMLKDIELDEVITISPNATCNMALDKVTSSKNRILHVVDEDNKLVGVISTSDLLGLRLLSKEKKADLLRNTSIYLFSMDCKGQIMHDSNKTSNGKVFVYDADNKNDDYKDSILVLNNKLMLFRSIYENPSLIIYSGKIDDEIVIEECKNRNISLVQTEMSIEEILEIIRYSLQVSEVMSTKLVSFSMNSFIDDISSKMIHTRYRTYPVLDENGRIIGSISRWHLYNYKKKRFILVDHSSKIQTIDNIDQAEIVEVIDHHHIGDISTNKPIFYRNQVLGSTCTIIYSMYKERGLTPTKEVAGIMLSAIISDTLHFKSQTTTDLDIEYAKQLAEIAEVNLDEYAIALLNSSVNIKTGKVDELVERDLKYYVFNGYKVAVGQTNYDDISSLQPRLNEFREKLIKFLNDNRLDLIVMMFTHVSAGGTMFMYYGNKSNVIADIIEKNFDEHYGYDSKIMSRKQQLIPILSKALEEE